MEWPFSKLSGEMSYEMVVHGLDDRKSKQYGLREFLQSLDFQEIGLLHCKLQTCYALTNRVQHN